MPEQRARKYHQERVAETLREEISTMIQGELSDPRISFAYVSEVMLNPGGKSARVYISVDGGETEEKKTREASDRGSRFHSPRAAGADGRASRAGVVFQIDKSKHLKLRIDELLGRTRKTQEADARRPPQAPDDRTSKE